MASSSSSWTAPSLARYRPAILALTALAAGCTIYYVQKQIWSSSSAALNPSLQRSNARRERYRRPRSSTGISGHQAPGLTERTRYGPDVPWGTVPVSLDFLAEAAIDEESFGDHLFSSFRGRTTTIITPLRRHLPSEEALRTVAASDSEAETIRRELEEAFLCFYFWKYLAPSPITDEQRDAIVSHLRENGRFSAELITRVLQFHQEGLLAVQIETWEQIFELRRPRRPPHERQSRQQEPIHGDLASTMQTLEGRETVADVDSEHSWREESGTNNGQDDGKEGQNLGNLLWRIAEEQARKEGYVHRGVTCNSCNAMPIKGIRYRCSNCVDFDLCEQCEALQTHPKTHLFYKVRIPAPFLGTARQPQPVWYPGRPTTVTYSIPKEIMEKAKRDTEYQEVEIEALWEQFRCLAATEWDDDPSEYNLAIDRRTFDRCFVPNTSTRPPPPNLIYDRAFSFYDMDNNELIGFGEFINGRAALTRKNTDERWKRVFRSYDINSDGFVDRRDLLRIFRAYYAFTKELTLDIVNGMEDDISENGARDIVLGSQPISSAFSGAIPPGERLRTDQGKRRDEHGDLQIYDEIGGAVDDRDHEVANPDDVLADYVEAARFGHVQRKGIIGPWVGDVIKNDEWPPSPITLGDLRKVFPHMKELGDVTSVQDQDAIRRVAHERVAREHQQRQFVRRITLRNRKQRQSFYLDAGEPAKEKKQSGYWNEGTAVSLRKNDKSRKDSLLRILGSSKANDFRMRLVESLKAMNWPLEYPEQLMNDVLEMIFNGWGGKEIAEDLSGYGSLQHDANDFVETLDSLISIFGDTIKDTDPQEPVDEPRKSPLSSSSRRSRSSSKVRFRDEIGTDDEHESRSRATSISSRSVPINERWGGFVPEPEKDVGREVLFQVTQEALNELLDPVFKLREDLALAAVRTRRMRVRHRAEIATCVKNSVSSPREIKKRLDVYQKCWRLQQQNSTSGYIGIEEIEETFSTDELLRFMSATSATQAGQLDSQTGEQCSRCKESGVESWVGAGYSCAECCKPSAEAVSYTTTDPETQLVVCPHCDCWGLTPGSICGNCGVPSKEYTEEEEKLWKIVRGTQEPAIKVIEDETDLKPTPIEDFKSHIPPEALGDLHSSVAAFNEANPPALEKAIAQKPLQDLLAESGYAAASPTITSSSPSPGPDPTFPQNRPIEIHEPNQKAHEDGPIDIATSISASSLSSIHTNQTPITNIDSLESLESPTPDPTLPQNRPNGLTASLAKFAEDGPASTSTPEHTPEITPNDVQSIHHGGKDQKPDDDDGDDAPVGPDMLMYYAALDILEAEDKERGGPGRLSFTEWMEIMKGEKGPALGFLGSWIEVACF